MNVRHTSKGPTAIVTLSGRLDAAGSPAVRRSLRELFAADHRFLVLDFAEVSFVDSSGLSVLVTALKNARAAGGDIALIRVGDQARMLLELTRLHRVFLVADDAETAMTALAA